MTPFVEFDDGFLALVVLEVLENISPHQHHDAKGILWLRCLPGGRFFSLLPTKTRA